MTLDRRSPIGSERDNLGLLVRSCLKRPKQLAALLLCLVTLAFLLSRVVLPANQREMRGFAAYYTAASLLSQGKLGPRAYDNDWFIQRVHTETKRPITEILTPTLPTVSLLALPLTALPPQTARAVWTWLNFFTLLFGLGLLIDVLYFSNPVQPQPALWLGLTAVAFVFPPVAANFNEDQAIILFFCLFCVTLWALVRQQAGLAGLSLGLAFILKSTGLSLWLLLLLQRRWRTLTWGIATIFAVVVLSLPWIGLATWWAYLQAAATVTGGTTKAVTAYQTTAGFLTHLFHFDPIWNPNPLRHWPALAMGLSFSMTVVTVAATLWRGRRTRVTLLFAALVPLSVILLPVAEEHHFVVMLVPIFVLIDDLLRQSPGYFFRLDRLWLALALILLVAPWPYEQPALGVGWWALLAYPRLYGGWLIWLVAVRRMSGQSSGLRNE